MSAYRGRRGRPRRRPRLACTERQLEAVLCRIAPPTPEALHRLRLWSEELDRWSGNQRLVGWSRPDGLLHEGVADAWAMVPLLAERQDRPLVDLGSGAGLPGLVLAAALPEQKVHLVESRRKRASFLRQAVRVMELENVQVHHGRSEQFCETLALGAPPTVTARAFAAPALVLNFAEAWAAECCIVSASKDALPSPLPDGWSLQRTTPGAPGPERQHFLLTRG